MPAVRASRMREPHGTAVRAGNQVVAKQSVVGTAAVASALGVFALRMGCHDVLLFTHIGRAAARPGLHFRPQDYSGNRQ